MRVGAPVDVTEPVGRAEGAEEEGWMIIGLSRCWDGQGLGTDTEGNRNGLGNGPEGRRGEATPDTEPRPGERQRRQNLR